jgi:uncharacterized membrane protein
MKYLKKLKKEMRRKLMQEAIQLFNEGVAKKDSGNLVV